ARPSVVAAPAGGGDRGRRSGRGPRCAPRGALDPPRTDRRGDRPGGEAGVREDRKSTRLNSSHVKISYAVFCLKKKKRINTYMKVVTYALHSLLVKSTGSKKINYRHVVTEASFSYTPH